MWTDIGEKYMKDIVHFYAVIVANSLVGKSTWLFMKHQYDDGTFKCDQCDACFIEGRALNSHTYKEHNVPKPHNCDICGKGFVSI